MYFNLLQNIGTIRWYGGILLTENAVPAYSVDYAGPRPLMAVNPQYKGEAYLSERANSARVSLTPNKIIAELKLAVPDVLTINQNYDEDFETSKGAVFSNNGLLAIRLRETGDYSLEIDYAPKGFYGGLGISLFSLVFLMLKPFWPLMRGLPLSPEGVSKLVRE